MIDSALTLLSYSAKAAAAVQKQAAQTWVLTQYKLSGRGRMPVSYTHLTLPTICSV